MYLLCSIIHYSFGCVFSIIRLFSSCSIIHLDVYSVCSDLSLHVPLFIWMCIHYAQTFLFMQQYDDVDVEKMKKYVQELELKNAELKQKLEAAQAQLKEGNKYINCDPLIDEELRKHHDVFLCPHESDYKKTFRISR